VSMTLILWKGPVVDDPDEAARLIALGADGIMTNDPARIASRLKSVESSTR